MTTKAKIKINDVIELRQELDSLYEQAAQVTLARWALSLAKHIMELADYRGIDNEAIVNGFSVNQAWQSGQARVHDVRQAGFRIHRLARECDDELPRTVLRVVGQAVGTGHLREHAIVASDYAVKVINLLHPGDLEAVARERQWQIETMKSYGVGTPVI
jgi:hypothetical protein